MDEEEEEDQSYNYQPLVNPNDVAAQSSDEGSYGNNAGVYQPQRYTPPKYKTPLNPFAGGESAWATPLTASRYASQPVERQQTQTSARNNLTGPDMDFYVNKIGDVNAGLVIANSKKGLDIFSMEQPYEYTTGIDKKSGTPLKSRFHIVPAGFSSVPMEDGSLKSLSNYELAKMFNVKTVPFKGGEKEASDFRMVAQKYQQFTEQAERLRTIYKRNTYLGPMDPSEDSALADSLQDQMTQTFMFIMNGAKMTGSGTSNLDTAKAESMLPRRSSYTFTHLRGNEMAKLDMALEMARSKLDTMAQDNGMMLLQPAGSNNSRSQKAPPGTKKIRNH